jgi:hypothetical protein
VYEEEKPEVCESESVGALPSLANNNTHGWLDCAVGRKSDNANCTVEPHANDLEALGLE